MKDYIYKLQKYKTKYNNLKKMYGSAREIKSKEDNKCVDLGNWAENIENIKKTTTEHTDETGFITNVKIILNYTDESIEIQYRKQDKKDEIISKTIIPIKTIAPTNNSKGCLDKDELKNIFISNGDKVDVKKDDNMYYTSYSNIIIITNNVEETQNSHYIPSFLIYNGLQPHLLPMSDDKLNVKKIHQIYISNAIHQIFTPLVLTWINNNPDFEYHLWTDNKAYSHQDSHYFFSKLHEIGVAYINPSLERSYQPEQNSTFKKIYIHHINEVINDNPIFFDDVEKDKYDIFLTKLAMLFFNFALGGVSDCIRYLILRHIGGVYSDLNDTECHKSLLPLITKYDFIIGWQGCTTINNSTIYSKKQSYFINYIIQQIFANPDLIKITRKHMYLGSSILTFVYPTHAPLGIDNLNNLSIILNQEQIKNTLTTTYRMWYPRANMNHDNFRIDLINLTNRIKIDYVMAITGPTILTKTIKNIANLSISEDIRNKIFVGTSQLFQKPNINYNTVDIKYRVGDFIAEDYVKKHTWILPYSYTTHHQGGTTAYTTNTTGFDYKDGEWTYC